MMLVKLYMVYTSSIVSPLLVSTLMSSFSPYFSSSSLLFFSTSIFSSTLLLPSIYFMLQHILHLSSSIFIILKVFELLHLPWIFLLLLLVHLSFSFPWLPSSIFILLEVFKLMYFPFYFPRLLLYHFLDFQFSSFSSLLFSPIMSKILEQLSILIPFSFSHFIFLMNVSYFAPHHM
jgi:hypothetical protein